MARHQIVIRIPQYLLEQLNNYMEQTGAFKTEVVVSALAEYFATVESLPLTQRVTELETRMTQMEACINS